jgi:hypothetical protein
VALGVSLVVFALYTCQAIRPAGLERCSATWSGRGTRSASTALYSNTASYVTRAPGYWALAAEHRPVPR